MTCGYHTVEGTVNKGLLYDAHPCWHASESAQYLLVPARSFQSLGWVSPSPFYQVVCVRTAALYTGTQVAAVYDSAISSWHDFEA